MSKSANPSPSNLYQIRFKGHLGNHWADWFENMEISLEEDGITLLCGPVMDDAELYGLLKKIRDLGMPLISVNRIDSEYHQRNGQTGKGKKNG